MRRDEQRARAPPEVLLEPLERAEVEVVRRLVEEQQVRLGDHEPRQRRARLLAARQRGRRLRPSSPANPSPPAPPRRAGRACSRRGPRTDAGGRRRRARSTRPARSSSAELGGHRLEVAPRRARTAVRRSGAAMNAASRWASWASSPIDRSRFRDDRPRVRLVESRRRSAAASSCPRRSARRGRSGRRARSPHRSSRGSRTCRSRGGRPRGAGSTSAGPPGDRRVAAAARRVAAARLRRSVRAPGARAGLGRRASPSCPVAAELGPAPAAHGPRPPGHRPQDRRARPPGRAAGSRWHHEQKCVERAPITIRRIGRPQRGHGSPVRW